MSNSLQLAHQWWAAASRGRWRARRNYRSSRPMCWSGLSWLGRARAGQAGGG